MPGALEGIKIIEVNRVTPGSFLTMMLGDMGAEVIRIEAPENPSPPEQGAAPPAGASPSGPANHGKELPKKPDFAATEDPRVRAASFVHRNKRSLCLDLKAPAGQAVLQALAQESDVLIEGFRPGVMKRLGADYETLSALNPQLVYCSLSGFGQDGPYRDAPAHDLNYLALSGVLSCLGGATGAPPIPMNLVADYAGATLHGAVGVLLALFARQRSGRGQLVDVSYLDTTFSLLCAAPNVQDFFMRGTLPERGKGLFSGDYVFYGTYETRDDKEITLACTEPWLWHNFCDAVERPDWKACSLRGRDFANPADDLHERVRIEIEALMKTRGRDEWFAFLAEHDVCVGPVHSLPEVVSDPQIRHRGMALELEHPEVGKVTHPGIALKLSDTPGSVRRFPPARGEHSDEILGELGMSPAEIQGLRDRRVI